MHCERKFLRSREPPEKCRPFSPYITSIRKLHLLRRHEQAAKILRNVKGYFRLPGGADPAADRDS